MKTKKVLAVVLSVLLAASAGLALVIGASAADKAVVLEYDADGAALNVYFDNCDGLGENGLAAFQFYVTFPADKLTLKKVSKGADLKATSDTPSEATYDANSENKYKDIAADFPALEGFADDDVVPGVINFGGYFKETLDASYYEDADDEVNAQHFLLSTITFEGAADGITSADFSVVIKNDKAGKAASFTAPKMKSGKVYFKVQDIYSDQMSDDYLITVKTKDGSATWTRSLITCAYEMQQNNPKQEGPRQG